MSGLASFLFGGPQFNYQQLPGSQRYIDPLANFDPNMYGGLAGGPVLKGLRQDYRDFRDPNKTLDQQAGFRDILGEIRAQGANENAMINRGIGGLAYANQPALAAATKGDLTRQNEQQTQNNIAQAASGYGRDIRNALQSAFENKEGRALQGSGMKLGADEAAAQAYQNSFRGPTSNSPGLLGGLVAGAAGAAGGGLGSLISGAFAPPNPSGGDTFGGYGGVNFGRGQIGGGNGYMGGTLPGSSPMPGMPDTGASMGTFGAFSPMGGMAKPGMGAPGMAQGVFSPPATGKGGGWLATGMGGLGNSPKANPISGNNAFLANRQPGYQRPKWGAMTGGWNG